MKTQISYKKLDGRNGVTLVNGEISSNLQAKRELANKLSLPAVDQSDDIRGEDIDGRLRHSGIDPESVEHLHISE